MWSNIRFHAYSVRRFKNSSFTFSIALTLKIIQFMLSCSNGQKLGEIYSLIDINPGVTSGSCTATRPPVFASFRFIQRNLRDPVSSAISSMEEGIASTTDGAAVDIQSCVHFLIDLYTQWLQNLVSSWKYWHWDLTNFIKFHLAEYTVHPARRSLQVTCNHFRLLHWKSTVQLALRAVIGHL